MCIPQQAQQNVSESDVTPDGSEPLLINKTRPKAPKGYMARFIEGKWRIVPDPNQWGAGAGYSAGPGLETNAPMGGGGGGAPAQGGKG